MDNPNPSDHEPLDHDQSHLPSFSIGSNPVDLRPPTSLLYRPGYQRVSSNATADTEYHSPPLSRAGDRPVEDSSDGHGLGITNLKGSPQGSLHRVPVGTKTHSRKSSFINLLQTPTPTHHDDAHDDGFQDVLGQKTNASVGSSLHQPYESVSDTERLNPKTPAYTVRSLESKGKVSRGVPQN